jgi:hypothetical protein
VKIIATKLGKQTEWPDWAIVFFGQFICKW